MRTAAYAPEDHLTASHQLFEHEVAGFRHQLQHSALKLTGNPADAEDLVQETMIRAYAGLNRYTPGTNARAWLYRIMANQFVTSCRKRQREPRHVLTPELDVLQPAAGGLAGGVVPSAASAEDEVLAQFTHSECRAALDDLPDCYKATIYLADVQGYSCRDVADLIGVPLGTVMSRLSRARSRVREQLAAHRRPGPPLNPCG